MILWGVMELRLFAKDRSQIKKDLPTATYWKVLFCVLKPKPTSIRCKSVNFRCTEIENFFNFFQNSFWAA